MNKQSVDPTTEIIFTMCKILTLPFVIMRQNERNRRLTINNNSRLTQG